MTTDGLFTICGHQLQVWWGVRERRSMPNACIFNMSHDIPPLLDQNIKFTLQGDQLPNNLVPCTFHAYVQCFSTGKSIGKSARLQPDNVGDCNDLLMCDLGYWAIYSWPPWAAIIDMHCTRLVPSVSYPSIYNLLYSSQVMSSLVDVKDIKRTSMASYPSIQIHTNLQKSWSRTCQWRLCGRILVSFQMSFYVCALYFCSSN